MKEKFINFLKVNKAHEKFIKNLRNSRYSSIDEFEDEEYDDWILNAFRWDKTPEGEEYWQELDDMWCNQVW